MKVKCCVWKNQEVKSEEVFFSTTPSHCRPLAFAALRQHSAGSATDSWAGFDGQFAIRNSQIANRKSQIE
jgi:hypothetical protein